MRFRGPSSVPSIPYDLNTLAQRVREQPADFAARMDLASALEKTGRLEEANQEYLAANRLDPRSPRPYIGLGSLAMLEHHPEEALKWLDQALKRDPNDADVWKAVAQIQDGRKATQEAITAYEHVVHLRPQEAEAWRQLGALYGAANEPARAREALVRATTLNPGDGRAQRDLGKVDQTLGRLEEARQAFEQAIGVDAKDAESMAILARIRMQLDPSPEGLTRSETLARNSIALHPFATAHLTLGQIALVRRNYAHAVEEFNAALLLNPGLLPARAYLSQAYAGAGKAEMARSAEAAYLAARARQSGDSGGAALQR